MINHKIHVKFYAGLVAMLLACLSVYGQTDSTKTKRYCFFTVNGGLSIPLCAFAPQFYGDYPPDYPKDYALIGYTINIKASYPLINSNWRGSILLGYTANKFNANAYSDFFSSTTNQVISFNYGRGGYNQYNALIGPDYSFRCNTINFDIRFLVGMLIFNSPEIMYDQSVSYTTPPPLIKIMYQESYDTKSTQLISLAYNAGIEIGYLLHKKYIFLIDMDIYYSIKSDEISTYYTRTINGAIVENKVAESSFKSFLLNPNIGIGYRIGK